MNYRTSNSTARVVFAIALGIAPFGSDKSDLYVARFGGLIIFVEMNDPRLAPWATDM